MPSASQLYGGRWLNAADLQPLGRRRVAVIHHTEPETVGQDQKTMLMLDLVAENGQAWPKKCPLNKGNTMQLVAGYGDDYSLWAGKRIEIWSENVMFQGKLIPGIKLMTAPHNPGASATAIVGTSPVGGASGFAAADPNPIEDDEIPF